MRRVKIVSVAQGQLHSGLPGFNQLPTWKALGFTRTSVMNFLQTGRMSFDNVALNIMTCLSWGVILNISCTSALMSVGQIDTWRLVLSPKPICGKSPERPQWAQQNKEDVLVPERDSYPSLKASCHTRPAQSGGLCPASNHLPLRATKAQNQGVRRTIPAKRQQDRSNWSGLWWDHAPASPVRAFQPPREGNRFSAALCFGSLGPLRKKERPLYASYTSRSAQTRGRSAQSNTKSLNNAGFRHCCLQGNATQDTKRTSSRGFAHLEREFACVAQYHSANSLVPRLELLQDRQKEDRRLAHSRLRLAQYVHTQDSLGNALVLYCAAQNKASDGSTPTQGLLTRRHDASKAGFELRRDELQVCDRGVPSEGCSKPQSTIALRSSDFRRKSLKPVE